MPFQRVRHLTTSVLSLCSTLRRWKALAQPVLIAVVVSIGAGSATAQTPPLAHPDAKFGKVPLNFEPNRGQVDGAVQFLSRGAGYALYLTPGEAVLQLQNAKKTSTLRMTLLGADSKASVAGENALPGTVNYFVGNDSRKWHQGVPTFGKVS